jgi:hypothetical protein
LPTYILSDRTTLQFWVTNNLGESYVLVESELIKHVLALHPHPYDASVIAIVARSDAGEVC